MNTKEHLGVSIDREIGQKIIETQYNLRQTKSETVNRILKEFFDNQEKVSDAESK